MLYADNNFKRHDESLTFQRLWMKNLIRNGIIQRKESNLGRIKVGYTVKKLCKIEVGDDLNNETFELVEPQRPIFI